LAQNVPTVAPKGGLIFGILTEGNPYNVPAIKVDLDAWITSASAPNTWTLDSTAPQPPMESYFGVGRDTYYLIELATMRIIGVHNDVNSALTDLMNHLP
jgi:hypothetical protein